MSTDEVTYRIADEPNPGALGHLAVNPAWPLLAHMFGGSAFAWIWFVFNGQALGSPTRRRELMWVVAGVAGVVAFGVTFGLLVGAGVLSRDDFWWGMLIVTLWKLGVSYWLYALQSRTFDLYVYFGGKVRSGIWVVVAAALLSPYLKGLVNRGVWILLVN